MPSSSLRVVLEERTQEETFLQRILLQNRVFPARSSYGRCSNMRGWTGHIGAHPHREATVDKAPFNSQLEFAFSENNGQDSISFLSTNLIT